MALAYLKLISYSENCVIPEFLSLKPFVNESLE